jgi:hypothetical protein
VIVPQVAPEHPAPDNDHVTAPFAVPETLALNCCFWLMTSWALPGETVTTIGTARLTVAEADFVGSAWEDAVTVTTGGFGVTFGAVYKPRDEIVPQLYAKQPAPVTFQVTLWSVLPVTVALNCCWLPGETVAEVGEIATVTGGGAITVTVAVADTAGSARDSALTVTVAGFGAVEGAV